MLEIIETISFCKARLATRVCSSRPWGTGLSHIDIINIRIYIINCICYKYV